MSKHVREKCGKLCISNILSSKRGITPIKIDANWRHSNLICSTVKQSHMQNFSSICQSMLEKTAENVHFQFVREKCGKLCISIILSSKRGITPSKIDANWRHSNLICSTVKQSHMQNFSSICQSMLEKTAENVHFQFSKFQKGNNSHKDWRKLMTLELDL